MLKSCLLIGVISAALGTAVPALALPDATIARITIQGANLVDGDRVPISVHLANRGDTPLPPVPVVLNVSNEHYAEWKPVGPIAPGQSATWSLVWVAKRGSHLVVVTADPLNDVAESDEGNNSSFVNVGVAEAREPSAWPALLTGGAGLLVGLGAGTLLRRLIPISPGRKSPRRRRRPRPGRPLRRQGRAPSNSTE